MQLSRLVGAMPHAHNAHSRSQSFGILTSYSVAALLMSLPGAWSQQLCKVWSKPLASVCFYGLVINL